MRQAFRKIVIVLALFLAFSVAQNIGCLNAEASYGVNDALGTIGISTGIGAVLGLSTISFYSSPTTHLRNTLIGAGAGLIVGLGVAAYLLTTTTEDDELSPDELLPAGKKPDGSGKQPPGQGSTNSTQRDNGARSRPIPGVVGFLASVPATLALRGSSDWMVAMRVLELRF